MQTPRSLNFEELLKKIQDNDKSLDSKLAIDSISEDEFIQLAKALENNPIIKVLKINKIHDLPENTLGKRAMTAISDLIKNNKALITIDLNDSIMNPPSSPYELHLALLGNPTLRALKIVTKNDVILKSMTRSQHIY